MEQQFILKLPEQLQHLDLTEAKLAKLSSTEVTLTVQGTAYPGLICRLPTIVESQKDIDGKLFKVADISTMVVISMKKEGDIGAEVSRIEANGLTPPMAYARERHVRPPGDAHEIEQRLAEMLREDARAESVEILEAGYEESSDDLDMLAAEIEDNLPERSPSAVSRPVTPSPRTASPSVMWHSPAPTAFAEAHGPLADHRPAEGIEPTESSKTALSSPAAPASPVSIPVAPAEVVEEPVIIIPPELLEIENKIKEKQDLLDKTLNPILKKRFSQAIADLRTELEAKRKALSK